MKLFSSKYWQTPEIIAVVRFHYNSHHYHYHHFRYYCKMYLYRLRILLTIPLDCNMIPGSSAKFCLLFPNVILFSGLIPSFSLFTPRKRSQNSFATTRQILSTLIFISIVIYTSLFTLTYLYLFTRTYIETTTKVSKIEEFF